MGITKDIFDIVTENTPLRGWLDRFKGVNERKRILSLFCTDFAKHPEHQTRLIDYFRLNEEPGVPELGQGESFSTSYRELVALWSVPQFYGFFEANLLRNINAGGVVHRTFVIGDEYFDPRLQLIIMRTGMRQTLLGFEPLVAHCRDIAAVSRDLGVECDMFAVANNRVADFIRMSPAPCVARTTNKKFIGRGWQTYQELAKRGRPFQDWLKGRSFADRLDSLLPEIEEECRLINEFASAS
jgi:hypothetical protein